MIQRSSHHQSDRTPTRIPERRGIAASPKVATLKVVTAKVDPVTNPFQDVLKLANVSAPVVAKDTISPFEQDVHTTLIGGASVANNPLQFATAEAAAALAKKLGGEVREDNLSGTFSRSAPQRMIVVAGANPINAGLAADLFAFYGDAPDSEAWRIINRDLGRGKS
ncbi:MAG: hypothetical protein M3Z85_18625 [Acidobacteriota bacterium]|nr:hypothetical protein [Acidobacteriota bacterium]